MSLKYKILLPTVALIALTMTVVTLTSYIKTSASLEKAITNKIELLTEEVKTSVNIWIQDRQADVLAWSEDESLANALSDASPEAFYKAGGRLAKLKRRYPMYENLMLLDAQGECRAASDSSLVSKLQLDGRAYFKQAMQGEMAVSDVLKSKATDNAIVVFAAPVKADRQVKGVVLGTVNVAYLAGKFVDHVKPGGSGYLYAFDRRGLLVAYPKKQEILKLNLSEYDFGRAMMDQKSGLISYEFRGVVKIVAFAHIPALDWIVASTANTEELFAPARELGQFNTIIAIISVLVAGLLAWLVSVSVVRSINRVMDTLNDGANQVAAASDQVSASSQSLAEGASEQAASLEESSTSLEQVSAMVQSNAENALQADELMHGNQTQVTQANSSMKKLKQAMKTISNSSDETAKVIKTIDEIAFQTNLLALNAAVEAARAGEAGAGFAVVADEVRNLSMRAAEAAKSTSNMIAENIEQIKTGAELVNQTDTAFDEVAKSSSEIDRLIKDIAEASKEQADGIKQLNHAVRKMDQVVQHNATDAEESAAAAEELSSQAQSVNRMVELLARIVGGAGVHRSQEPELINNAKKMHLLPWRRA